MDLTKKYKGKTIAQMEKEIRAKIEKSSLARKDATLMLYYLKISGRFKENPLYAKSSFKTYLEDVHSIREGTFNDNVRAYVKFPKEAVDLSVGLVASIHRKCGVIKEKAVLDEIVAKKESLKTPIKRVQIEKIISKHAKPVPPKKPGYKALYDEELQKHQVTKDMYRDSLAELKASKIQIYKLKKTVLSLREAVDAFKDYEEEEATAIC